MTARSGAVDTATVDTLMAILRERMAAEGDAMAALVESTGPKVTNGHSDGRRVRYVRAETRAAVYAELLRLLDGAA